MNAVGIDVLLTGRPVYTITNKDYTICSRDGSNQTVSAALQLCRRVYPYIMKGAPWRPNQKDG